MSHYKQIQEIVFEYFKDTDNETLIYITESFSFHMPAKKEGIGKIIEKFINVNGLSNAYVNYLSDFIKKEKGTSIFRASSPSDLSMIEGIKNALIVLCFNRFRQIDFTPKKEINPTKIKFLGTEDIEAGTVCIVDNFRGEHTLCGTLIEGSYSGKSIKTEDRVSCNHCLRVVKYCNEIGL